MNIDNIAKAIEADAGMSLPGLKQSLEEMRDGKGSSYSREQILIRAARKKLDMSQQAFADLIKTPVATLRDWEQGRFAPPGAALRLAEIALKHPGVFADLAA